MVDDLADAYRAETGKEVERIYGNMSRVIAQARASHEVDMVLGDAVFLNEAHLPFVTTEIVGKGKLVAIFPKGKNFSAASDFLAPEVTRIAIPDTARAIYGKASVQFLKSTGMYDKIEPRLMVVATVPQAASYVVAGEVDYALINLTHARKIEKNIGGYAVIDANLYSPINIIIGQMQNSVHMSECADFINFLHTDKAHQIVTSHGM